jgi:WD40 repeat protein
VYCSALIFSPEESVVRQTFKQEIPQWISSLPRISNNWNPCLQALEGHGGSVYSVAFSPNGQQLALGSDDRTVRVWDASTGRCLQTLEGHGGSVYSVAFSHNGQQLASGSSDRTVRVWDNHSHRQRLRFLPLVSNSFKLGNWTTGWRR